MYSDNQNDWGYGGGGGPEGQGQPYYYYPQQSGQGQTGHGQFNQQQGPGGYPPQQPQPGGGGGGGYSTQSQHQFHGPQQQQGQPQFYNPQAHMGGGGFGLGPNSFNPVLTDMAKQYGESLVGQGKSIVDQKIQRFVSVSKLKYYFAVDTTYVIKKIGLLLFPFTHKEWSIRYEKNEDDAIQPRFEVNAPDLYIPLMAFITFLLVAGISLGTQQKFTPEALGIQGSSALGWLILEMMVFTGSTYVIPTDLKFFDLLAFCSYKFVGMIAAVAGSMLVGKSGFYSVLGYFSVTLVVFLIRTLKAQIYTVTSHEHVVGGNKRRLYLLLTIAGFQPVLMWWLTFHLAKW